MKARGWCDMHYKRYRRHGNPERRLRDPRICITTDCEQRYYARGWCKTHYQDARDAGLFERRPPRIELIEEEAWCGWTLPDVARRLGCTEYAVERACQRSGRLDVWHSIQRRTEYDVAS